MVDGTPTQLLQKNLVALCLFNNRVLIQIALLQLNLLTDDSSWHASCELDHQEKLGVLCLAQGTRY